MSGLAISKPDIFESIPRPARAVQQALRVQGREFLDRARTVSLGNRTGRAICPVSTESNLTADTRRVRIRPKRTHKESHHLLSFTLLASVIDTSDSNVATLHCPPQGLASSGATASVGGVKGYHGSGIVNCTTGRFLNLSASSFPSTHHNDKECFS